MIRRATAGPAPLGLALALGLGLLGMLGAAHFLARHVILREAAAVLALGEIETGIATAHLWIEEYVTGDEVDLGVGEASLARSRELLASLAPAPGVPASDAGEVAARHAGLAAQLARFEALTVERRRGFEAGLDVGIGTPVDVEYDRAFARLSSELGRLRADSELRLAGSERSTRWLFGSLLAFGVGTFSLVVLVLRGRERRRRQSERELGANPTRAEHGQRMEAVGRMAGGLAHDVNNYLAAISAQCELVKMGSDDEAVGRRMDAALAATARASSLIERLLAFSRRQPIHPLPRDLNRIVEGLEPMLGRLLGDDVHLEVELAAELWPVTIDAGQVEQILVNLAVNAREAMPTGGALGIESANAPGIGGAPDEVVLWVRDAGDGIPEDLRERVFEPFFSTKEGAHSGLGLATVLGIVEQNGGSIRLTDARPRGTVVEIRLPRSEAAVAVEESAPAPTVADPGHERVLLVEDNDQLRRSAADLLAAHGYRVTVAADAEAALAAFAAASPPFELVVTDVVMPGLSGRELADRLRARDPGLSVLFVSGYPDDVTLRHGIAAGREDFLQKPFTAAQLAAAVRRGAARRDAGGPGGAVAEVPAE